VGQLDLRKKDSFIPSNDHLRSFLGRHLARTTQSCKLSCILCTANPQSQEEYNESRYPYFSNGSTGTESASSVTLGADREDKLWPLQSS
jgi:hypothetical protein